jgi:hypothetical protein
MRIFLAFAVVVLVFFGFSGGVLAQSVDTNKVINIMNQVNKDMENRFREKDFDKDNEDILVIEGEEDCKENESTDKKEPCNKKEPADKKDKKHKKEVK